MGPEALAGTGSRAVAFDDLVALAEEERRQRGIPGVALGLIADGRRSAAGVGRTEVDGGAPVDRRTRFRLASVTKPFTASLLVALAERHGLDLDRPVVDTVPRLRLADAGARASLTTRQLLAHTGGFDGELPGTTDLAAFGDGDDALARVVAAYGSLRQWAAPGAAWGYCNTGYWLAGAVASAASGRTYEGALTSLVLRPLGLGASSFDAGGSGAPLARPHRQVDGTRHEPIPAYAFPRCRRPSGGLVGSVDDVLAFAAFHLLGGDGPFGDTARLSMQAPAVRIEADGRRAQGLGWAIETRRGGTLVGHDGDYRGYATRLVLYPDRGAALVVLTNSDAGGGLHRRLASWLEDRLDIEPARDAAPVALHAPDAMLDRFSGSYGGGGMDAFTVTREDDGLVVAWTDDGQPRLDRFALRSPDVAFAVDEPDWRLEVLARDDAGRPSLVRFDERLGGRTGDAPDARRRNGHVV